MAVEMRRQVFRLSFCIVVVASLLIAECETATDTMDIEIEANTDLSLCTCDMTAKACDVNCCCDKDCDADDKKAFSRCIDPQTISDSQMCVRKSLIFLDNSPYTKVTNTGNWLCIHIDNFRERNFYKVPQTVVSPADFDKFQATYGRYSYKYEISPQPGHTDFYRSGDPLLTVYQGLAHGVLGLPAPLSTSKCADSNPAAFLYNQEFECVRQVNMKTECNNNPFINANLYYRGFRLIKTPSALKQYTIPESTDDGFTSPDTSTTPVFTTADTETTESSQMVTLYDSNDVIDVVLFSVTCFDENKLEVHCKLNTTNSTVVPSPHYQMVGKGPALCMSVVTDVEYFIKHAGKDGLEKAYVKITLADVLEEEMSVTQRFKINFYKSGEVDTFRRSGRPGYVVGEPVMAGKLKTNVTIKGKVIRQAIELNKDRSKWLTLVSSSISRDCISSPDHRTPVTFGEETRAGCMVKVTLQNMTNNCAFIQDVVLEALRGIDPPTHVATFGDSSVTVVGDWVAIEGLYTQPPKAQKAQDGVCRNLIMGMLTQIVYADVGSLQRPQSKILGVLVTYQTDLVKFQCVGKYCQPGNTDTQTLEVASTVSFIDVSTSPTSSSGKRPTLPLRLPSDFFYPFT